MAVARQAPVEVSGTGYRLDASGIMARAAVAAVLLLLVAVAPLITNSTWDDRIALMAIWGIIGLSVNVITGYAGQLSLGHQAFVGIGAFTSAYVVSDHIGAGFIVGVVAAGLTGAFLAFALGLVALRIKGLYFALVTLSFGLMAQETIFNYRPFTGGGAGAVAPRPTIFQSNQAYAYLCMIVLAVVVFVDWRMSRTKGGRAVVAVRNNENGAATLGVNVSGYKLLAFAVGGCLAGIGGGLYAHWNGQVYSNDYDFLSPTASPLIFLLMAVVGGLGSRAGIIIASAFFAVFPLVLPANPVTVPGWLQFIGVKRVLLSSLSPLIGALLLLLTVILYPGGIGQQLLPIRRWLAGGPFREPRRRHAPGEENVFQTVPTEEAAEEAPMLTQGEADEAAPDEGTEELARVPAGDGSNEEESLESRGARLRIRFRRRKGNGEEESS